MSTDFARRWKLQADADFKAAKDSAATQNYSWAAFGAQQAAEKYLKAFLYAQGQRILETHSLRKLAKEAADHKPSLGELDPVVKELDKVYFTSRYPDAFADDIPAEYFTHEDAKELIEAAKQVKTAVEKLLPF